MPASHKSVVIIGSGFGGSMTGLSLARAFQRAGKSILMLERGTWWTTPVSTVQDKDIANYQFLTNKGQPVQYWSSLNHSGASSTCSRAAIAGRETKTAYTI